MGPQLFLSKAFLARHRAGKRKEGKYDLPVFHYFAVIEMQYVLDFGLSGYNVCYGTVLSPSLRFLPYLHQASALRCQNDAAASVLFLPEYGATKGFGGRFA